MAESRQRRAAAAGHWYATAPDFADKSDLISLSLMAPFHDEQPYLHR